MSLCCRYIVAINAASDIDVVTVVCSIRCLARVTLHRRDIVSIDATGRINVPDQHAHRGDRRGTPSLSLSLRGASIYQRLRPTTHTPVANPADADATVVAAIVRRRRIPVAIACIPASCGLGTPKGKKRRGDHEGGAIVRMRI